MLLIRRSASFFTWRLRNDAGGDRHGQWIAVYALKTLVGPNLVKDLAELAAG